MKPAVKAVLFDLDGTLLDTAPDFVVTLNNLLQRHGKPTLPDSIIRETVSDGARALVTLGFQLQPGDEGFEALRQELLQEYTAHLGAHTTAFPGIPQLLTALQEQQVQWGIVTNKPSLYSEPLMARMALSPAAATLVCPDHVTETKPHPEPLYLACKQLNCTPAEAIYIGDHLRDIEAGRRAGMTTIAAAYGYVHTDDNARDWQADYLAETSQALPEIVLQLLNERLL